MNDGVCIGLACPDIDIDPGDPGSQTGGDAPIGFEGGHVPDSFLDFQSGFPFGSPFGGGSGESGGGIGLGGALAVGVGSALLISFLAARMGR